MSLMGDGRLTAQESQMQIAHNKRFGKYVFNSMEALKWLIILVWTRHTLVFFGLQVVLRLPFIGFLSEVLFPMAVMVLLVFAWPRLSRNIRVGDIIFYILAVLVILVTMFLVEENAVYLEKYLVRILINTIPLYFLGLSYRHEEFKETMFFVSALSMLVMAAYQVYKVASGRLMVADDMDAAYKALPAVMYLIYYAFVNKKIKYWVLALIGIVSIFLYGTRGPVACILVLLLGGVVLQFTRNRNALMKVVLLILVGGVVFLISFSNFLIEAASDLSEFFSELGFSTRVFNTFIEGAFTESTARESIFSRTLDAIMRKPIAGHGVMGDWVIFKIYCHNLFLELLCHYGVFLGTAFFAMLVLIPLRTLFIYRKNHSFLMFLFAFVCISYVKLMFTGSYLFETNLYFLLGICVSCLRGQQSVPRVNLTDSL